MFVFYVHMPNIIYKYSWYINLEYRAKNSQTKRPKNGKEFGNQKALN